MLALTTDGNQRIVRLHGTGMTAGLELLQSGEPYHHTAVAVTKIDACRIPVTAIEKLEQEFPQLCNQIRVRLQQQLDRADEWIVELGTGPARKRVAHLMLLMMDYSTEENDEIPLLSGNDIGAIIGASPETVSRIMAEWKRSGILKKNSNGLYRGDARALEDLRAEPG